MAFEGILFGIATYIGYKFYEDWSDTKKKINDITDRNVEISRNVNALVEYAASVKKRDEETAAAVRSLFDAVKRVPPPT
jgi:hypothetical protein